MVENKSVMPKVTSSAMLFASIYNNVLIMFVSCEKRARETLTTVTTHPS